ncbi:UNVERIFIED_CONTAM: hypothetical protein GTU68_053655 [Idotea baltica]|nr:hypothetical protein [Idotea baltica]
MLCSKGMNLNHVVQNQNDRLLYPKMRWNKNQDLQRVTWDAALDRASAVFSSIIKRHGPDSVGLYVSGQCTTEEYYLANKLTKGFFKTNNIDTNSRLCMSSAVVGYKNTLGDDIVPICYDDIELSDCFFIAGANPAYCHPILFRRLENHKKKNPNVNVIVVDPRKTQTSSLANIHLQINPGTDSILYNALCRRIIENGEIDHEFIENHTVGFNAVKKAAFGISLEEASRICGIPIKQITQVAKMLGSAKALITMWAMGLNQSAFGVEKNLALLNINLLTGQIGKPGAGPFSLTGQPNAMGGREVGGMANLLAAHKDQKNPKHREEVAKFWGVSELSDRPGLTATEMFENLASKKLKAIWIICTNPAVSMPDARKIDLALKNAQFVIVQDISNRSDTLKYADLVLPAAGWAEKEGVMTNSERRIAYLPKVIDPPGEAKPDAEIIWRFAQKMGYHGFSYNNTGEVFDEHCRLTKGTTIDISGLNYNRLKNEGSFQWPVPYTDHPGTARIFTDKKFYNPSKKAHLNPVHTRQTISEPLDEFYPLVLTTGRLRDQWHTKTRTGKVNKLNKHEPQPFLEISQRDASKRNLTDGDIASIVSKRGDVRVKIRISSNIKEGVVFMAMHWGKKLNSDFARVNNLTNRLIDPISKQPDFKYSAVQVLAYEKTREKICVIGGGAAAFQFVQSYRTINTNDEIHVFSDEANPFYNRILLPEYVSDHLSWEKLAKIKSDELEKLNLIIHKNKRVQSIDRNLKTIEDSNGKIHNYDKLIMATGSRPNVPGEIPVHLDGVFTIRSKEDADQFKHHLHLIGIENEKKHVVIVGGGLLGLEMAAALRLMDIQVTVIHRGSRLMQRQLDAIGSKLLEEDVLERDINLFFDNEVSTINKSEDSEDIEVLLRSGKAILCNAIIYAIGTKPNIEIARDCGLNIRRGLVVNDYLRTSDENIFAIGEIAEWRNQMFGITSAAEQQATVLANYMNGDLNSSYSGSVLMNILKFNDLDLCSIGNVLHSKDDPDFEEVVLKDLTHRYYKKCIIYKDRMVGAILIGDKSEFSEYKRLIETGTELSSKRTELLRGGQAKPEVIGKIVCTCNTVGYGNIINSIDEGYNTLPILCENSGAGLACGSCKPELKEILTHHKVTKKSTNSVQNGSPTKKRNSKNSIWATIGLGR